MRPVQVVVLRRRPGSPPVEKKAAPIQTPMTRDEIRLAIGTIKERLSRISGVSRTNPHQFAEDKSEVYRDLSVLEDAVRKGEPLPERLK